MKLLAINQSNYGSTGKIMIATAKLSGAEYLIACANSRSNKKNDVENVVYIGNRITRNINLLFQKYTGLVSCSLLEMISTANFLRKVKQFSPDLIHLHNLHDCYISLPLLFRYIKKHDIPVVWTLHDCWAFTGRCPHFEYDNCEKWVTGCEFCPYPKCNYPQTKLDRTKVMWRLKRKWFSGVKNLTIVTPSRWLANMVKMSYLKEYTVEVINNGIDLTVFKPTESDFREKYGLQDKHVILGVAFEWTNRKGLDVFVQLAKELGGEYQIVLVGTDDEVDKMLPSNILSIHRTQNQRELAEIYTAADVFVNPTKEDTFPTVNIEALACGTLVVTFDTGGAPECIIESCGFVVDCDDIVVMENEIIRICEQHPYTKESCLLRSKEFDQQERFDEYRNLYWKMVPHLHEGGGRH